MKKSIYILLAIVFIPGLIWAQDAPYNIGFSPSSASVGETVFISGINFSTNPSDNLVYFGAGRAQVVSASENQLEVIVPANATYGNIRVTDVNSGLTAFSPQNFLLSFGNSDFSAGGLSNPTDLPTNQDATYDLCMCDFNSDGKLDIAVSNQEVPNAGTPLVNVYVNNSSVGSASFNRIDLSLFDNNTQPTLNTICGDLDGDGRPDLVFTDEVAGVRSANNIYIFRNTSSGAVSFANATQLSIPNQASGDFRESRRIEIKDLDQDGKAELIITNSTDQFLYIFNNKSSSGSISFASTPIALEVENPATTSAGLVGLAVDDLNGDGFPDIAVSQFQARDIYVFRNKSEPGNIDFGRSQTLIAPGNFINLKTGDLNGDGLSDIAITNPSQSTVNILMNETTGRDIVFGAPDEIGTAPGPWGLDMGDLNGDGLLDIAVSSLGTNPLQMTNLINTTNNGVFGMETIRKNVTGNTRNVKIGDLDGDARPDLALTSFEAANLMILLNKNCIIPEIKQETQTVCSGSGFQLEATKIASGSYQWFRDGQAVSGGTSDALTITQTGRYTVQITQDGTGCSLVSAPVDITVAPGAAATPQISAVQDVCIGDELRLTSTSSGTSFIWKGPNGFTGTGNPLVVENFSADKAGRYTLQIQSGSCLSAEATIDVGMRSVPLISIEGEEDIQVCEGTSTPLRVANFPGYNYEWRLDGSPIPNSNSNTFDAVNPGNYTAVIQGDNGCSFESEPFTFSPVPKPVSSFGSADSTCFDVPISFTAASTGNLSLTYSWDFGDGSSGGGEIANNTYNGPGTFTVTLTTGYAQLANCETSFSKDIVVVDAPNVEIQTPQGTEKCPGEPVTLALPDNLTSYSWNNGSTTNSISVVDPGTYSVVATNDLGCEFSDQIQVTNFQGGGLTITSSDSELVGDSIKLRENQKSVDLQVSGGDSYEWSPLELVAEPTASSITVFPRDIFTIMTVTGNDANGCEASESVSIINEFVTARTSFSPNGDGIGFDCWEISNTRDLNGCTVYIFDNRGRNLFVADSPFENDCIWNGTTEGIEVPEGVYFYVMKCDDTQFNRSGSIMLAR